MLLPHLVEKSGQSRAATTMRVVRLVRRSHHRAILLMNHRETWDLFCHVVDNYGDIGFGWRLARQLVAEHGRGVRLYVDDLNTFRAICPQINPRLAQQTVAGVQVLAWARQGQAEPGEVVVELFGCRLLPAFVERLRQRTSTRWVDVEHLSAEGWVAGSHLRPSPQPGGANRLFFFPGFTKDTGGLLREAGLLERRDTWQAMPASRRIALRALGMPPPPEHAVTVLLFGYSRTDLEPWLQAMASGSRPTVLWICPGPLLASINAWLRMELIVGHTTVRGSLTLCALPFVEQDRFDELLWSADVCFVRGEDSFVRAQWAARPFVWHIYRQDDDAHQAKLEAFLDLYLKDAPAPTAGALRALWGAWNQGNHLVDAWAACVEQLPRLRQHAESWSASLAVQPDLATQLVRAVRALPAPTGLL